MLSKSDDAVVTFVDADGDVATLSNKDLSRATKSIKSERSSHPKESPLPKDRLITKIKLTSEQNLIQYTRSTDNHEPETCTVQFRGAIHPDFESSLNSLIGIVIDVVGLNDEHWQNGFVSSVSLKHEADEIGCVVTAQRREDDRAIVVNTPYLKPEDLDREQVLLKSVCKEAKACIDGKRAQGDLFGGAS